MITKLFEIRDKATFIPVIAIKLCPATEQERYLLGRAGFGTYPNSQCRYVIVVRVDGGTDMATSDPYHWHSLRTMTTAHNYIIENFDELDSCDVIDVEHILGETEKPKRPERLGSSGN